MDVWRKNDRHFGRSLGQQKEEGGEAIPRLLGADSGGPTPSRAATDTPGALI